MSAPLLPIDRRWIQQELVPYLRCAFSHLLAYDADISAQLQTAVYFCMHKPDYPTDGDDLLFERICQAIEFRHKNLAADLSIVTENLEPLAKFLIRRAQLKGTFELLGRMNIASGAWRDYEEMRLERLRQAAEDEELANLTLPPTPPPKTAPTEEQIDPRLIYAQSGHFVSPELSGALTVADNHYYRRQNQMLSDYRQNNAAVSSLEQPLQEAARPTSRSLQHVSTGGYSYGQAATYPSPSNQPQAPSYVQSLGQSQGTFAPQVRNGSVGAHNTTFVYQQFSPQQLPLQHLPILAKPNHGLTEQPYRNNAPATTNSAMMTHAGVPASAAIPTADISHLRGNDWAQMAEQRVRDFGMLSQQEKAQKLIRLNQAPPAQSPFDSSPTPPQKAYHEPSREGAVQQASGPAAQGFENHPGYSNIRSSFPAIPFSGALRWM
ncbi:hypothetical protein CC86DRAFT_300720 [Ophiobolus disseminans]|uniref:Uncharacterized protein n=1 Tax=Ophiobolus disseminans TaxID=1469910 RepID=A0A6A6ZMN1_9PLEO|nr:hypothetical protein CC86DRAFT_300720 [Ophiobolus disseminans]